jgi:hypothetical protein
MTTIASEKLDLKRLMDNMTDYEDNTHYIRSAKHSHKMALDIEYLETFKRNNIHLKIQDPPEYIEQAKNKCSFLLLNYPDIFNRLVKDELDLAIMSKFIQVLRMIEDGQVDQQDGSVLIGKLLKELYIDSAIKTADNIDKQYAEEKPHIEDGKAMTWKDYKNQTL